MHCYYFQINFHFRFGRSVTFFNMQQRLELSFMWDQNWILNFFISRETLLKNNSWFLFFFNGAVYVCFKKREFGKEFSLFHFFVWCLFLNKSNLLQIGKTAYCVLRNLVKHPFSNWESGFLMAYWQFSIHSNRNKQCRTLNFS